MPFCSHCGIEVGDRDLFCAKCGRSQAPAPEPPPAGAQSESPYQPPPSSIRPNIAALLCYIPEMGWIASVIFLTVDPYRKDRYVRFHALQGLFLFVAYLFARLVFAPIPVMVFPFSHFGIRKLLQLLVIIAQVVGIVKTARGDDYRLPIVGELAEKSMI